MNDNEPIKFNLINIALTTCNIFHEHSKLNKISSHSKEDKKIAQTN